MSELYRTQVESPEAVDRSWHAFFEGLGGASLTEGGPRDASRMDPYRTALILGRLIETYRWRGHRAARLDPLGIARTEPDAELLLDRAALAIVDVSLALPVGALRLRQATLPEVIARLEEIYCGAIGWEYMHLDDPVAREWLRAEIEDRNPGLSPERRIAGARRLIEADEFEALFQKRFVAKKLFGAEGAEALLCLLWSMLEHGVERGLDTVVLGGTSRARLSQLINFVGKPAAAVIAEIADKSTEWDPSQGSGDVPYHLGYTTRRQVGGREATLIYCANPSHLEAVNAVALGRVRAMQDERGEAGARAAVMPLLVHTDAAFAGQGVVAELFQMSGLRAYSAGGTIHAVINNQVGFTTEPSDGRTSRYCTDVAKAVGAPVFHVNADDVDAVLRVGALAMEFRQRFGRDVVVDLVCYRRKGHNELDEPAFTQPLMAARIAKQPTARRIYLDRLRDEGVLGEAEEAAFAAECRRGLNEAFEAAAHLKPAASAPAAPRASVETGLPPDRLRAIGAAITAVPAGISAHPKVARLLAERAECLERGGDINWGFAEALALGSLLAEGTPVRLVGQDTPRGAFSHRHYYVHDQGDGRRCLVFEGLPQPRGRASIHESLLAEYAALGFEYGYSLAARDALVIWEAQFGDFANVAQPVLDQFVSSSADKWGEPSRLAVLLPHGLEGQGPEHSSGRIERFLQMCARDNWTVANCSTPANYFHLLRHQALNADRPLVLFTPKSLLRSKLAVATLAEMETGTGFEPVIAPVGDDLARIVLCSGKIAWELEEERRRRNLARVGIARLERLYPFPGEELAALVRAHPAARFVWCQEEPLNMGAWTYAAPLLADVLGAVPAVIGRPANPAPTIGTAAVHAAHQAQIIAEALGEEPEAP